ncbi:MAG: hypothetical protein GY868_12515, partial [Deltaproteobacteria bacterium]|nr:hypothetical protein [Deltaproteobacteria bacterium]
RPLARLIQSEIKDVLADQILFGNLTSGGSAVINLAPDTPESISPDDNNRHMIFSYNS